MSAAVFEFVVAGRLGPSLRSRLSDLDIRDRPPHTRLVLRCEDQTVLLSVLAAIAADHDDDQGGIDSLRTLPDDADPGRRRHLTSLDPATAATHPRPITPPSKPRSAAAR